MIPTSTFQAYSGRASPGRTLELWRDEKFSLVASPGTVAEIGRVLKDFKIRLPEDIVTAWTDLIVANCIMVKPTERLSVVLEDPDDNIFLEAAVAGEAGYLVSQDKHLLKIKEFRGIRIMKPEEFNRMLYVGRA